MEIAKKLVSFVQEENMFDFKSIFASFFKKKIVEKIEARKLEMMSEHSDGESDADAGSDDGESTADNDNSGDSAGDGEDGSDS